ncbi:MAG: hypothetical protein ABI051_01345 [Vicinamibacterales bacterium]
MIASRSLVFLLVVAALCTFTPTEARAQFYADAYLGGNRTLRANVSVDQPERGTGLTFHDVTFSARPLASPQYYGVRLGRLFGQSRHYGAEIEFIHLKVISNTDETVRVTGQLEGAPIDETLRMDTLVQRYAMTHGLNFLLLNAVARRPIGDTRVALIGRAGAGPTYPHAESRIGEVPREQYEYAGVGVHVAAGTDIRLRRALSASIEYKCTAARPRISVVEGRGRMHAVTHQIAIGLAFGLSR